MNNFFIISFICLLRFLIIQLCIICIILAFLCFLNYFSLCFIVIQLTNLIFLKKFKYNREVFSCLIIEIKISWLGVVQIKNDPVPEIYSTFFFGRLNNYIHFLCTHMCCTCLHEGACVHTEARG